MPVLTYKCKNCSGELIFNPDEQNFGCPYCQSNFVKEELENAIPEPEMVINNPEQVDLDAVLYSCPSCGAEVVTDSTTAATFCFYCHNPVVLTGRLGGKFTPSRVIPFKFDKNQGINKFLDWAKKKFFLPKDFISKKSIEKFTGVYFPYWVIDADADSNLHMNAKRVRSWNVGDTRYTETSVYKVHREGEVHLEDIVKTALNKADKQLIESVQPFDSSKMEKFSMTYLSGFQAEKRDIESAEITDETIKDINKYCEELLKDTVKGFTSSTVESKSSRIKLLDFEYCLLPVWVMTYKYGGTDYYFAMNGQSGKICGKLPVDKLKLFLCSSAIAAATGIILTLGGLLI